jgi:hypothetical protein
MIRLIFILAIVGFASCGHSQNEIKETSTSKAKNKDQSIKTDNALAFINGYVSNVNKMKQAVGIIDWVNSNKLTTSEFKLELKRIIDEAYKNDPELGIEADPIFDAQDNPYEGFVLESFDDKSNYLIVKGVDWPDFKLTMKIKNVNGVWLVDGCGMVNIPNEKRVNK